MLWFTSDTHFNHENVIGHSRRPFSSLVEMEEALIYDWNFYVSPGDTVYHLGDFALSWGRKHAERIDQLLARLNGDKWLITGNHDRKEVTANPRWRQVLQYHELKVDIGEVHKQRIVMCHYPMRSWNQMHRGAWMLHGHSHHNLTDIGGKILDVGVDGHQYRPISFDEVFTFMNHRRIQAVDHHVVEPAETDLDSTGFYGRHIHHEDSI